jgi:hypothetical protein
MTSKLMFAAFGAALLIAACSAATAPPSGSRSPTAAASSSPTPMVFTSTRYRYSITLPSGWVASRASETWDGSGSPAGDEPMVDAFTNPHLTGQMFDSSAPTKSLVAAWVANGIAENFAVHGDKCPQRPNSVEPVTISGQPGSLVAWNCDGTLINMAFTVTNGYGYRFVFRDPYVNAATDPADMAIFTTMLGSVVFH